MRSSRRRCGDAFASGAAELKTAEDILGRLKAVASWLEHNDPHFAYETHTWEVGQSEPERTPGVVMSHVELDDRTGRRIDAVLRGDADDRASGAAHGPASCSRANHRHWPAGP